jgi:hypothetical protein
MSANNGTSDYPTGATAARELSMPPGFAGVLADAIHNGSFIQLYETAIPATLALLAGVTGRAYRTPTGKDLSQYQILVAPMAVGKDAIHDGIPALLELAGPYTNTHRFVRREDFVSGAALHRAILETPGFVNLQGEFGRKLQRMANPTDSPMQELRTKMTRAYSAAYMDAKTHSRPEDSISGVKHPAFSFLGETTPRTFFDVLGPEMMEDGFLSRFLVTFYDGHRPASTKDRAYVLEYAGVPAHECINYWRALLTHCAQYHDAEPRFAATMVEYKNTETEWMLDGPGDSFEELCRCMVNTSEDPLTSAVWGRAHLKAQKIASQLAVADWYQRPVITTCHVRWAIEYVQRDIALFEQRQASGEIGIDDVAREKAVGQILRDYMSKPVPASYGVHERMRVNGHVTFDYLRRRTRGLSCFGNAKLGSSQALNHVIQMLVARGVLHELPQSKAVENYGHFGKCYNLLKYLDEPLPGT